MNDIETGYTFVFEADTKKMRAELQSLNAESLNFGKSISNSFEDIIFKGKDVESVFKNLAQQISRKAFSSALQPVEQLISGGVNNGVGSLFGSLFGFAKGGAFANGVGASGLGSGVINSPMAFPMAGGSVGLAGEAGPEAILPLTRGANGELGVRSSGSGAVNITVNISTPDIEGFRRSEGEVAASLQRMVSRGNRNL